MGLVGGEGSCDVHLQGVCAAGEFPEHGVEVGVGAVLLRPPGHGHEGHRVAQALPGEDGEDGGHQPGVMRGLDTRHPGDTR